MLRVLLAAAEIACHCHVAHLTSAYRHRRGSDSQLTRTATHSHCAIRATTATNFPFPTLPQQRTVLPPPGAVTLAASSTRTAPLAQTTALSWQVNVGRTRGSLPCVCMLGCPPPPASPMRLRPACPQPPPVIHGATGFCVLTPRSSPRCTGCGRFSGFVHRQTDVGAPADHLDARSSHTWSSTAFQVAGDS